MSAVSVLAEICSYFAGVLFLFVLSPGRVILMIFCLILLLVFVLFCFLF